MAIVNYHCAKGRLIGEDTNGIRTDYMTDALGSVTGTVNSSQVVVNTYRYKPFGELLAKTGSGADPKFMWNGGTQSRKTGLAYSEQYNRARHYGTRQGQWTTVDPLWPEEPSYSACHANPTTESDPFGEKPEKNPDHTCYDSKIQYGDCNKPDLRASLWQRCLQQGTVPCLDARVPKTPLCPEGCCVVCHPKCSDSVDLGGVLCSGSRRADILKCAKSSLRFLGTDTLAGKAPEVRDAIKCPKAGMGNLCTIGSGFHVTYVCNKKKGQPDKRVISSTCCPCYYYGSVRYVCYNNKGCHSGKG